MEVKVIMTYDIKPGRDQEYFAFMVRELTPGLERLGLQPTEGWYTTYGKRPQIMMGGIAPDYKTAEALIQSPEWKELNLRLSEFVTNYRERIIRVTPFLPIV